MHIICPNGKLRVNAGATIDLSARTLTIDSRGKITRNAQTADGVGATLNRNLEGDFLLATSATISAGNTAA